MTMDREKEREVELEFAMLTNCLLLGVDPGIIGITNGMPKTGLFRHSNVRMGEYLLHFILSALRGPVQAAKDFDKVWPICDSAQSRDFRKIVQGIINELESQGALPRSNSRVSSLATCCGQRFVELLWQLSVHALREVHKRTYPADVATNPLPSPLTDLSLNHAATLLPVTKARIALERRKFLKNATEAVHRQGTWSALAHDITAEYRGLCAEEAYLQQELEKIHDLRNKAKLEGEIDGRVSSSVDQSSHLVLKATRLWDSLLARKNQHEILASGPIEDLIAHREHRYRISGSSLLAAVDQSRQVSNSDTLSAQSSDTTRRLGDQELLPNSIREALPLEKNEAVPRPDDKAIKAPVVDVAEILRCWTHALQRIHKQSLLLAKANDGDGPELLRSSTGSGTSGHAESLAATLEEHHQHLASIQVLVNQLKEVVPTLQQSITELREEVDSASYAPAAADRSSGLQPAVHSQENKVVEAETIPSLHAAAAEQVYNTPALKLPHLFSLTPTSSSKGGTSQKRQNLSTPATKSELLPDYNHLDQPSSEGRSDNLLQDSCDSYALDLKRAVRKAAFSARPSSNSISLEENQDDVVEHYFVPLSRPPIFRHGFQQNGNYGVYKDDSDGLQDHFSRACVVTPDQKESKISWNGVNDGSHSRWYLQDLMDPQDQIFSPPLLMDSSFSPDAYEDLLAPFSEIDDAMMEH